MSNSSLFVQLVVVVFYYFRDTTMHFVSFQVGDCCNVVENNIRRG